MNRAAVGFHAGDGLLQGPGVIFRQPQEVAL